MIEYSTEARQLCSTFTQFRNSINIYTEDELKDKKFYRKLFNRLLEGTDIVINDVIPLGNCNQVIDICKKDNDSRPKLYIVDGDIHLMTTPKKSLPHLFVLDRYCIENYVIDKDAYYKVFNELDFEHELDEIRSLIDYDDMMIAAVNPLTNLFCHFAVCQETIGKFELKDIGCLLKNGTIDIKKADYEMNYVKKRILDNSKKEISEEEFNLLLSSKMESFSCTYENLIKYVSGKDYLIPYILAYSKNKLKQSFGLPKGSWKYQFAKHCQLDSLEGLKKAIIQESNNANLPINSESS